MGNLTTHLSRPDSTVSNYTLCGQEFWIGNNNSIVDSVKDCSCYYCKLAWEKQQENFFENKEVRVKHISALYDVVRKFRSDNLNSIMNPDLYFACEKIPGLKDLNDELYKFLSDFEDKIIKFADDNYPIK